MSAKSVVLDMRGYPNQLSYDILADFLDGSSQGMKLSTNDVASDGIVKQEVIVQKLSDFTGASGAVFQGKVALLVGPNTQSSAEHLTAFFLQAKRGPIVGEPTSGADGNITGVLSTQGFGLSFTGMRAEPLDGSVFQSKGFTPTLQVEPTANDLVSGNDPALLAAAAAIDP
jgi:C-terminal processing protease CtpA/Prc